MGLARTFLHTEDDKLIYEYRFQSNTVVGKSASKCAWGQHFLRVIALLRNVGLPYGGKVFKLTYNLVPTRNDEGHQAGIEQPGRTLTNSWSFRQTQKVIG